MLLPLLMDLSLLVLLKGLLVDVMFAIDHKEKNIPLGAMFICFPFPNFSKSKFQ